MKKILCSFIVLMIFLSMITVNLFAEETITIDSITPRYTEDSVTISGNTTLPVVSIKILYPNGDPYNVESVQSSNDKYSYTFRLSSDLPYGDYTVVAGKGNTTASTTFLVKQQSSGDEITIDPIPDKYPGDSVTISGNTSFSNINIKVLYPNGDQYNVETVTSSNGTYTYTFKLSSDLPYGDYTVLVGSGDKTAYTKFEVISETPDDPDDPDDPEDPEDPDDPKDPGDPGGTDLGGSGTGGTGSIAPGDKGSENLDIDTEEVNDIIENLKALKDNSDISVKALRDAEEKLLKKLETAIYKSVQQKIDGDIEDSKLAAIIDELLADSIISSMDDIVKAIDELNKKLTDNGITNKAKKKIEILLDADSDISSFNLEIPSGIFNAAEEKGIEAIEVMSSEVSFEFSPDFIEKSKRGSTITINVDKITLDNEAKSKLSESQRQVLNQQGVVYDLSIRVDDKLVSTFNKTITVRIKYELSVGEDKDNITILYLAGDGSVKNMTGKYDEETKEAVFITDHFSMFFIKNMTIVFSDVKEGFWAKSNIESMAAKGIINGLPGGTFNPGGMVTRAEFAKMITVAMGIVDEDAECEFKDMSKDKWHYKYVASAVNAGIVKGRPDNTFGPDDNVSRQEMAVMVFRAMGEKALKNTNILQNFNDRNKVPDWSKDALAAIIEAGIINGKPGSIIDPEGYSTRAEAAAVIYRFFNY